MALVDSGRVILRDRTSSTAGKECKAVRSAAYFQKKKQEGTRVFVPGSCESSQESQPRDWIEYQKNRRNNSISIVK
jgi:hypothetical protein